MSTVGATAAIFTAVRAFVGPGDNAVVISPAYAIFANDVVMAGGEPRAVPLARRRTRFALDLDRVRQSIDGHTRLIVVNSPSNPTGWMITVDEQRALYELAEPLRPDDSGGRSLRATGVRRARSRRRSRAVADRRDRLIVVNSFSKTYNMTGWRLGWAQSSERVIRSMYKAAEFITSNPPAMVQQAGIVALRDGEPYIDELRAHYAARREQVRTALAAIPGVSLIEPQGAFYAFFAVEGLTRQHGIHGAARSRRPASRSRRAPRLDRPARATCACVLPRANRRSPTRWAASPPSCPRRSGFLSWHRRWHSPACVAHSPVNHRSQDGAEILTFLRERVFHARRVLAVAMRDDDAGILQAFESVGKDVGGNAFC